MALDVAIRCSKCGKLFAASREHGIPDLMAYCPNCASLIERRIRGNMMETAGILRGSVRIEDDKTVRLVRSDE